MVNCMGLCLVCARNSVIRLTYKLVFRRIFFFIDPETIHDRMIYFGAVLGSNFLTRDFSSIFFGYSDRRLRQDILGIKFRNPVGLAAGFDKDAKLTQILPSVGFGFAEVGSITGEPCLGNSKPRLWRLKKSNALVVNYGLKNEGCERISERLRNRKFRVPIGTSIAKTNSRETVSLNGGIKDYVKAYRKFTSIGSYSVINVSCPNAFGGEYFSNSRKLEALLKEIDRIPTAKPVFLKLSPDLGKKELDAVINVAGKHKVAGFICGNLSKKRENRHILEKVTWKGGLSGRVVEEISNNLISYVYRRTKGKYIIIGCGGIFSAEDAYRKIKLGASLVQLITGMIFEGPQLISEINHGLAELLEKDGFSNISGAVGSGS